tara:strand:- start:48 stop:176 length:129 start_codon:yes stop_codon:yes gene_type:complete
MKTKLILLQNSGYFSPQEITEIFQKRSTINPKTDVKKNSGKC